MLEYKLFSISLHLEMARTVARNRADLAIEDCTQHALTSLHHSTEMEFLDINLTKERVFCTVLFTVPSLGGFYRKTDSSPVLKILTKNTRVFS